MSTDRPSSDPRAALTGAIDAVARSAGLEPALEGVLAAAIDVASTGDGRGLIPDPDRPGLQLVASHGMDEAASSRARAGRRRPGRPVRDRGDDPDRHVRPRGDDGRRIGLRRCLPAARRLERRGRDVGRRDRASAGRRRAPSTTPSARRLAALAGLAALAVDRARLASTAAERSEWFERMAHTDPLTGLANERTVGRILELELARAARQGSEVSFAMFDVDDFRATNTRRRPRGRRRRPATGRLGPRRIGPAGRHGRAGRWRRVRAGRPGLGRARSSRSGSSTASPPCRPSPAGRSRSRPVSRASRRTARIPAAHRAAADARGLARSRGAEGTWLGRASGVEPEGPRSIERRQGRPRRLGPG